MNKPQRCKRKPLIVIGTILSFLIMFIVGVTLVMAAIAILQHDISRSLDLRSLTDEPQEVPTMQEPNEIIKECQTNAVST
jgi:hypothetical protein